MCSRHRPEDGADSAPANHRESLSHLFANADSAKDALIESLRDKIAELESEVEYWQEHSDGRKPA